MRVNNVHRRAVRAVEPVATAIETLSSADDAIWPRRWPPMRLDRGLEVGSRGGHGPIRYTVEAHEPGRRVRFRFERPRGLEGYHELSVRQGPDRAGEVIHVVEAQLRGWARLSWPLVFRPLHDALIEDALDNAQQVGGQAPTPARWSPYVRWLRKALARAAETPRPHPAGGESGTHRPAAGPSGD